MKRNILFMPLDD